MAEELGLFPTIESDDEVAYVSESSDDEEKKSASEKKSKKSRRHKKESEFNDDFVFDLRGRSLKNKKEDFKTKEERENEASDDEDVGQPVLLDGMKIKESKKNSRKKKIEADAKTGDNKDENISYADVVTSFKNDDRFEEMGLTKRTMMAINAIGWERPTPIQSAVIPIALLGKDVCACAATGTGKTGAFMIPIIDRITCFKQQQNNANTRGTRVLVLTPTRELAIQNYEVTRQLIRFTNLDVALSAGGTDRKAQEASLRRGPDIVIATLGRLIDHLHNGPTFNLNNIEVLVLDEADRMLDEYNAEQMKEVLKHCCTVRQTLLFSATMTELVKDLTAVSLKNPVKIFVNNNDDVAMNLKQEFIRIREQREDDREAIVAALVKRHFEDHCIVFVQTKKEAHRLRIVLNLLDVKAGELHGNLTQPQRLEALQLFRDGELDVLLATDLVARGLDIPGVKTVINKTMPPSIERYIHRVGRTARAGRYGTSVTLVGEKERTMLAKIVNRAKTPAQIRTIDKAVVTEFREEINQLEKEIKLQEKTEKTERMMRSSEQKLNKAMKIIEQKEIESRPKRTWFQSHHERKEEKEFLKKLTKGETSKDEPKAKRPKLR